MPLQSLQKAAIHGSQVAWVYKKDGTNVEPLWFFDNLEKTSFTILNSESGGTQSEGEKYEIETAQNVKIQFPKTVITIDGVTGDDITPAAQASNLTNKAEITLGVRAIPPTQMNSWTAFIKSLNAEKSGTFLVVIPTSYSYVQRTGNKLPEGYVYMFGVLSGDIEVPGEKDPPAINLVFKSCRADDVETAELTGLELHAITWWLGGTGKNVSIAPTAMDKDLTNDEAALLKAGDVVIKVDVSYT